MEGACSLDKALNAKAWLSAAKTIEKIEEISREREPGTNGSACDEPHVHECDDGILVLALLHVHNMRAASWQRQSVLETIDSPLTDLLAPAQGLAT